MLIQARSTVSRATLIHPKTFAFQGPTVNKNALFTLQAKREGSQSRDWQQHSVFSVTGTKHWIRASKKFVLYRKTQKRRNRNRRQIPIPIKFPNKRASKPLFPANFYNLVCGTHSLVGLLLLFRSCALCFASFLKIRV